MRIERDRLLKDVVRHLGNRTLSVFVGAGLSGGLSWKALCEPYMRGTPMEGSDDYIDGIQYYLTQENRDPVDFKKEIAEKFDGLTSGRKHEILGRLPIRNYWTTNFDKLLEEAIAAVDAVPAVMRCDGDFTDMDRRRDKMVYKLHGDVDSPADIVISKTDYDGYIKTHRNFVQALEHEFIMQSVLFLGYGMRDPDIYNILNHVNMTHVAEAPKYMILCLEGEDEAMLDFKIKELDRKGIDVCVVPKFEDVDKILEEVYRRFMARKVLISGSSCGGRGNYGKFSGKAARKMLKTLGMRLVEEFKDETEFSLISGYGLNVGPVLMDGAAQAVVKNDMDFGKRLLIYPFPEDYYRKADSERGRASEDEIKKYREKMIDRCGVVFFLFGMKKDRLTKSAVEASGVRKEFEIAHDRGKYVFPIGVTGGMSETLAKDVMEDEDFEKYNGGAPDGVKELYFELNKPDVTSDGIVDGICEIVRMLSD